MIMTWILDLLKAFWKPIAGILAGAVLLWRNRKLKDRIDQQNQVIRGHEAKEKVHRQDQEIEDAADTQINTLRGRVRDAETDQEAAAQVGDALNEYFGGKK